MRSVEPMILLITPFEKWIGMDTFEIRDAFAQWINDWIAEIYGEPSGGKNKNYRRFAERIKTTHVTVGNWTSGISFPKSDRISTLCRLRGIGESQFWQQLEQINKEQRLSKGIVTSRSDETLKTAQEAFAAVSNLPDNEKAELMQMLFEHMRVQLSN